jgi:SAM-dependent methyltransferase
MGGSTHAVASRLAGHYEGCFLEHGRTPKGVDWPNAEDLATRFEVMLGVIRAGPGRVSILDLGCGPGLLVDHLEAAGRRGDIDYAGIDLSAPMLTSARAAWPGLSFEQRDILAEPLAERSVDYVILNGVLTERVSVPREQMIGFATELLAAAFKAARVGIAFNVMSKLVDWEREDLFHWGFDEMASALAPRLSRHMTIRADYGLREYTTYVYREPGGGAS